MQNFKILRQNLVNGSSPVQYKRITETAIQKTKKCDRILYNYY